MAQEDLADYLLSLPERVVRSASAVGGGLPRELGDIAVPAAVRRSRLYQSLVESTLRFLIEQASEVEGVFPAEGRLVEKFAFRRTAGNGQRSATSSLLCRSRRCPRPICSRATGKS